MASYDDNDFLEQLSTDRWEQTFLISGELGCTYQTANRRLIQLAKEGRVEVLDPDSGERGIPENETTSRPIIHYRLPDGDEKSGETA